VEVREGVGREGNETQKRKKRKRNRQLGIKVRNGFRSGCNEELKGPT